MLDQNDKELLETEENLLIKIQQTFFALERTKLNNQKQQNHNSDQVRLEEQKREEEPKKVHKIEKRQGDIRNPYKLREIEATLIYSQEKILKN